ncbi:MAG: 16S rRNA (adenine(1518)-N(6)/adenine(1519)-N(6))-dimethyltransferase RsmA [Oscillospiraceae bacterium]|nr:16S rRNA (adenine(1518)-N(6)/adenine(1519)-N(6))-dimethyltransferase RsmA [Oscillospiraceae bacterium]
MELCNPDVLRLLLKKHGFSFSRALGQNFLIKAWVPREIAENSGADKNCAVLEIGPGVGCLTKELSQIAGRVIAVELDRRLLPLLDETLSECGNVEIVNGDIMKLDIEELIREKAGGMKPVVCANLPYNITSPVLVKLINAGIFDTITVMIQREVAWRICASAGDADYGALSVFVNYHMHTELLFDVTPDCFMPQPKVTSAVIKMTRRQSPPAEVLDEKLFFAIVRASFDKRRKTLPNALCGALGNIGKDEIVSAMNGCGLDANLRGEALDIAAFARLSNAIYNLK